MFSLILDEEMEYFGNRTFTIPYQPEDDESTLSDIEMAGDFEPESPDIKVVVDDDVDDDVHTYCKPRNPSLKKQKKIGRSKNMNSPYGDMGLDDSGDDDCVYCICRTGDTNRFMIGCDSCNEWYHGDCISITEDYAKNIKQFFCLMCRERDSTLEIKFKDKKDKPDKPQVLQEKMKRENDKQEDKPNDPRKKSSVSDDDKARKKPRRCGECTACYRNEDCGRCDFCKDMRKFGGPNKIRQKCRQRQCMNFGLILGKKPKHKEKYGSQSDDTEDNDPTYIPPEIMKSRMPSPPTEEDNDLDEDYEPKRKTGVKSRHRRSYNRQVKSRSTRHRTKKDEYRREHRSEKEKKEEVVSRQCYGPGCIYEARPGSKYCSDECGIKLATNRIYEILPHRIQQWQSTPCAADENNRIALEAIRRDQQSAKKSLTQLDETEEKLDKLILKAKETPTSTDQENTDGDEESELSAYCVTCGHEIGARTALKHMEKCFNKYESQTSFGSIYKTHIEGTNIFCDYYNSQQRTYCKRLRVLCPEHCKEPKVADNEVCGCPLVANVFDLSGDFCRIPKKKCVRHYQWEKLRKAEIDMERMRIWFKLDDLVEQERNIRVAMANRGGVLGLMLHQTLNHENVFDVPPIS